MAVEALSFLDKFAALTAEQRLRFLELRAHNLTIAVHAALSVPNLSPEEKVDSTKHIDECLHHATAGLGAKAE